MSVHDDAFGAVPGFDHWDEGLDGQPLSEAQLALQQDLSCFADGELDEARAAVAMMRIEDDADAASFLADLQGFAKAHRELADPDRLLARMAMMTGAAPLASDVEHRLASIFYQLGKAYLLAGLDPNTLLERVFEAEVAVDRTRLAGRGFVDGVVSAGRGSEDIDWQHTRALLNGRLERIEDPLEKAVRLLDHALEVDPDHEEARFYLAYLDAQQGRTMRAQERWTDLFDSALKAENRGHAAIQLGRLHQDEGNHRRALGWYRWILMSGLAAEDPRFWVVHFNIAMTWLAAGDQARSLDYFRSLIDARPDHVAEVAAVATQAPLLQETLEQDHGFAEALLARCPELFQTT